MLRSAFVVLAFLCLSQLAFGADHDHPKFHNAKRNKKSVEGKIDTYKQQKKILYRKNMKGKRNICNTEVKRDNNSQGKRDNQKQNVSKRNTQVEQQGR